MRQILPVLWEVLPAMAASNASEADGALIESALRCIEHYLQSRPPRLSATASHESGGAAGGGCCGGTGDAADAGQCACRAAAAVSKKTGKARVPAKRASLLAESDATQLIQCLVRFTSFKPSLVRDLLSSTLLFSSVMD